MISLIWEGGEFEEALFRERWIYVVCLGEVGYGMYSGVGLLFIYGWVAVGSQLGLALGQPACLRS